MVGNKQFDQIRLIVESTSWVKIKNLFQLQSLKFKIDFQSVWLTLVRFQEHQNQINK